MMDPTSIQQIATDAGWPAAIAGVLGILIIQVFQFLSQRRMEGKVNTVHSLVNSGDKVKLERIVDLAIRLERLEPSPANTDARIAAQKELQVHNLGQAVVDSRRQ